MRKTKWGDYEQAIPIPTFGQYHIYVVFTHNIQESVKARFGYVPTRVQHECAKALHKVADDDMGTSYIFFPYDAKPEYIAHESWHAIRHMLEDWAGASLENETVAYHLGYLVGIVFEVKSKVEEELHEHCSDSQGQEGGLRGMQSTTETGAQGTCPQTGSDNGHVAAPSGSRGVGRRRNKGAAIPVA